MKKHIWTTMAIILGIFTWISGVQPLSGGQMLAGEVILLSALACRSANKRRLQEVIPSTLRMCSEFAFIVLMIALVVLQNGLMEKIYTDPVPNLIIPIVCFIFYMFGFFKAKNAVKNVVNNNQM